MKKKFSKVWDAHDVIWAHMVCLDTILLHFKKLKKQMNTVMYMVDCEKYCIL